MKTLREYLDSRDQVLGWLDGEAQITALTRAWLDQDEVRELLVAAWDPQLVMTRVDHGVVETSYEDPDTGQLETLRAHHWSIETTVRGVVHGMMLATDPDRVMEGEMLEHFHEMHEVALRNYLIDVAMGKKREHGDGGH